MRDGIAAAFQPVLKIAKEGAGVEMLSPLPLTPDEYKTISDKHTFDPKDYDQTVRDRWLSATEKPL